MRPTTNRCPFCAEPVPITATKCPYCESSLAQKRNASSQPSKTKPAPIALFLLLLVCLSVIGIGGAIIAPKLGWTRTKERDHKTATTVESPGDRSSDTIPNGCQYYAAEHGAYELVNKTMPYRGDPTALNLGCQGAAAADPDSPSIGSISWNEAVSWDYLQRWCKPVDAASVPIEWRAALTDEMKRHLNQSTATVPVVSSSSNSITIPVTSTNSPSPSGGDLFGTGDGASQVNSAELIAARDQIAGLQTQIDKLSADYARAQGTLNQKERSIDQLSNQIRDQDMQIDNLRRNLSATDNALKAKDREIGDITSALERKIANRSVSGGPPAASDNSSSLNDHPEQLWANVPNFRPELYKLDMQKRMQISTYRNPVPPDFTGTSNVSLRFTIEKDGRLGRIHVLNRSISDPQSEERAKLFVQSAGPFRPLISNVLQQLDVEVELAESAGSPFITIRDVQISALGNST